MTASANGTGKVLLAALLCGGRVETCGPEAVIAVASERRVVVSNEVDLLGPAAGPATPSLGLLETAGALVARGVVPAAP